MNTAVRLAPSISSSLGSDQLVAFVLDDETRRSVTAAIEPRWPAALIHEGGLTAALSLLSQEPSPPLLVVDFSGCEDPIAGLRSLLSVCQPGCRIVALGDVNDIGLYHAMVTAGAANYVLKPIDPEVLVGAIEGSHNTLQHVAPQAETHKVRVMCVLGARGGVGTSLIATNTAWLLAHEMKKTVAIIDLDVQFGTVALSLDLEPSHGLREALEHPGRIDGLFLASAMVHESENLFVFSAEEPLEDDVHIQNSAFEHIVENLPADLDAVVVDLPSHMAVTRREVLAAADCIVVVSDPSLAGMRDTLRLTQFISDVSPNAVVLVVANKVGAARSLEIPRGDFEKGVEMPVRHFLPFDPKVTAAAANAGKPLATINRRSELVAAIGRLAEAMAGERPKRGKMPGIRRLFGKSKA